ncbi:hypothetical protein A2V56_04150 [Candidatus Woesebacteria bacterium RBG_19FT_COMBO_42_9]|uniref:Transport permease protein n=1 Tax=Candidatus Woesebacteria bacterium RBG_16_42_24 TaxID=1802485 RepID=A0A1F7XJN8_9BACT|nr:MAG: hypothetical protein A2V97_01215 [Candidatus Woesebacteria bacterium RBG_16_42_24]OGM17811.1 MAG: hypothetical protein A2V56_04150 [Candidatus Woesebacteria bacterium RBG_19FT_COMBO_42_9]OGM68087.1 MAG: hypothetical protein A2985_03390 [Candidatus Woesebacteria bacterium RIFCSPLOWO2_01_FULL_43_11]
MNKQYFEFIFAMTEREFKTRYKRAIFGFIWVLINPILQMLIIGIIFSYFIDIPNYFIFLFSGLMPWNFITATMTRGTPSFVSERLLIKKAKFPLEAIPLSVIFSNFIHLGVSVFLFLGVLVVLGGGGNISLVFLFLSLIWLLLLSSGLVFFTSTLHVKFRDINFITQAFLIVLFYATPILYDLSLIPERLWFIFYLNPLTSIVMLFQCSFTGQCRLNPNIVGVNILIGIIVVLCGVIVFRKNKRNLVDWL